jgi:hypothetical protein
MLIVVLPLLIVAAAGGAAHAQSESTRERTASEPQEEAADEVIVRGRRLGEIRFEVQAARERAYDIFNEINSSDEFDIHCRDERRYHSRATRRVCRARFETRISADAGQEYLATLRWACPDPASLHDCMFSGRSGGAISAAQGIEGEAPNKRDQMSEEILRLARENAAFAQAILDFYEASQQYEAARKQRDD